VEPKEDKDVGMVMAQVIPVVFLVLVEAAPSLPLTEETIMPVVMVAMER
jgi:hypothetical protein